MGILVLRGQFSIDLVSGYLELAITVKTLKSNMTLV